MSGSWGAPSRSSHYTGSGSRSLWTSASPSISIWPQPVYTTSVYAPAGTVGFGSFLFYSAFAYVAFRSVQSALFSRHTSAHGASHGEHDFTTIKIQVGLLSSSRWLQAQLESIAHRVDTSSQKGLHHLLQETLLAMLRNPDVIVYGATDSRGDDDAGAAERAFNRLSMEERSSLKRETVVNVGGFRHTRDANGGGLTFDTSEEPQELVVVTLLLAARGHVELSPVRGRQELMDALRAAGTVREPDLMALEILWSPAEENDALSERELTLRYPHMVSL